MGLGPYNRKLAKVAGIVFAMSGGVLIASASLSSRFVILGGVCLGFSLMFRLMVFPHKLLHNVGLVLLISLISLLASIILVHLTS